MRTDLALIILILCRVITAPVRVESRTANGYYRPGWQPTERSTGRRRSRLGADSLYFREIVDMDFGELARPVMIDI